jgi:cation diffusion facilitator family transporter
VGLTSPELHAQCLARLAHDHAWGHEAARGAERRTRGVIALTLVTMVVEVVAGLWSGSLALLADGLHMGSHVAALSITAWAYAYARRHAHDQSFSFGTGKVGALSGFASALLLGLFALGMGVEGVQRLLRPEPVAWGAALVVAALGLVVNLASAAMLHEHEGHEDHNLRSARLHVLADAFTSVLAIVALAAGRTFGWTWLDAAAGLVGAVVIVRWSVSLVKDSAAVLLDRSAPDVVCARIREAVETGSADRVADLHVWRVAPDGYAAVIAIVSDTPRTPDTYRALLPPDLALHHVNVEIHPCQHGPDLATGSS